MRLPALIGILTLTMVLPASAALPPQYQRQAELRAIIENNQVVSAFGSQGVEAIEWVSPDLYQVRGGACTLDVVIIDVPNDKGGGWVGPRQFYLEVGETVCEGEAE